MSLKRKGTNAERELIHLLWSKQIPAVRVAGSGSSKYPSPDILAGNNERKFAFECKSVKGKVKYIPCLEIEQLQEFVSKYGCEAWIAIRFSKKEWHFLSLEDLLKTPKSYAITHELIAQKGLLLDELL